MNYLAHLYLSGSHEERMIGNFIGDHVKGSAIESFPIAIRQGIILHRAIDRFTDTHPVVESSKARLRSHFRKYAPVIVDLYYDHFLAVDWPLEHNDSLEDYSQACYGLILSYQEVLPERVNHMLSYMIPRNWLLSYRSREGLHRAFMGMSRRARFESRMEEASGFLEQHYGDFQSEFRAFFPDLKKYCADYLLSQDAPAE